MAEYQRTIDEIRFFVQSEHCEFSEELKAQQESLALACREVNARLRRCGEFLRQGLRSEAIQMAEAEPKLLDLVALLDFPERGEWDDIAAMYALPRAEPLLLDLAEQLNEAYATEAPLQKLLTRHRLLALSQGPLRMRLEVLRRLCDLDPESTFWEDDVREFEKARLREIDQEAQEAVGREDADTLKALVAELGRDTWRVRPSEALVRSVRQRAGGLVRSQARDELEMIADELNQAFGSLDRARGLVLREQWQQNVRRAKLADSDPLAEFVAPALGWLADEEARDAAERDYQKAVAALERGLDDDDLAATDLERLGHAVLRFERGMPEVLHTRLRNRISALHVADTRQRQLTVGGAVACVVLIVGLIGFFVYRGVQAEKVTQLAQSIEQMLTDGQLAEARALYDRNLELSSTERWLNVGKQLTDAEQAERSRAAKFAAALAGAETAAEFKEAQRLLAEAETLARSDEEKASQVQLRRTLETAHRREVAALEQEIGSRIDAMSERLVELKSLLGNSGDEARITVLFPELTTQLTDLQQTARKAAPKFDAPVQLIARQLTDLQDLRRRQEQGRTILASLAGISQVRPHSEGAEKQIAGFAASLEEYAKALPEDARSADFRAAAAEADLWKGAAEWQRLMRTWPGLAPADAEATRGRIAECEGFLSKYAKSPSAAAATAYLDYLRPLLARHEGRDGDESEGVKAQVVDLYSGTLIAEAYILEATDGTAYYVGSDTDFSSFKTLATFKFVTGFNGQTKSKTLRIDELSNTKALPAPQSEIAEGVIRRVPVLGIGEWDDYFHELTETLLKEPDLDPFLKYFLVLRTVEHAAAGSGPLARELERPLGLLRQDRIDLAARWMDPEDTNADAARKRAAAVLAAVRDPLLQAWTAARPRAEQLESQVFEPVSIAGWLDHDVAGGWVCRGDWKPQGTATLRIALPDAEGSESRWRTIGSADEKGFTIRAAGRAELRQGRLVFAVEQSPSTIAAK